MSESPLRSPREGRRESELAQRRADAIAGASAVFATKGYHDAQMTEIAAAAELSRASLYAIFEGKDEIYRQVVVSATEAIRDTVQATVEAIDDPRERLLCVIDSLFICYEENEDLLRIYTRGTSGLPWRIRAAMGDEPLQLLQEFTAWMTRIARVAKRAGHLEGLDPETFAVSLLGAVNAAAAHWLETTPERPLSRVAPAVRAVFERVLS